MPRARYAQLPLGGMERNQLSYFLSFFYGAALTLVLLYAFVPSPFPPPSSLPSPVEALYTPPASAVSQPNSLAAAAAVAPIAAPCVACPSCPATPPPLAETGGLANAIVGSLIMVSLATALGTPIGVMSGVYLAEYGKRTWLGAATGFISDILLSAPSIVIGLFIYAIVVAKMKTFSGYAGILALALIVIPVVVRTTENMLQLIPRFRCLCAIPASSRSSRTCKRIP
jgi:ABC-type glycerol-3-phosphate transport system permease component